MMFDRLVEELYDADNDVDATQIAELLWLASEVIHPKEQTHPKREKRDDETGFDEKSEPEKALRPRQPKEVTHTITIRKGFEDPRWGVEEDKAKAGLYGSRIRYQERYPNILKQLRTLRIKGPSSRPSELDEAKSADYIAITGLFHPVFKSTKERQGVLHLNILVDRSKSMFLWDGAIKHVQRSLRDSPLFAKVDSFYFDSDEDELIIRETLTDRIIRPDSLRLQKPMSLTLLFSDVVGKGWQEKTVIRYMKGWSKESLVILVSMLPKRMWQKTPLRLGISQYLKNSTFLPRNRDLKAEYAFIEEELKADQVKIPVIPYDEYAFGYIADIVTAKRGSWIESRIFTVDETTPTAPRPAAEKEVLTPQERVRRYFAFATNKAKELAIYASVLPLHKKVLQELIAIKALGEGMDAFTEFYFGGLLDRGKTDKQRMSYGFYDGVRRVLIDYITIEETKSIYAMLDRVIQDALGVKESLLTLLYEQDDRPGGVGPKEQELVRLLIEVLGSKGEFFTERITTLSKRLQTGSFEMGSDAYDDERPIHTVTFDYSFEIGKYPVTFKEYDHFCEMTGRKKPNDNGWGRGERPVVNVSWNDAKAYCAWINEQLDIDPESRYAYRLPSEAEWEYAARAGTTTKWGFGDDEQELGKYAWYSKNSDGKTHPVGKKKPNPWELYDMHGNVWEWCEDDGADDYKQTPIDGSPYRSGKEDDRKVLRGGSWFLEADDSRSSDRSRSDPVFRIDSIGFRLLRTLPS